MAANKERFFKDAAKRFAASTMLYKIDAFVHVENKDDIWFWKQLLLKYKPGRYRFLPTTRNERGNNTSGCSQCLKYRKFLSQRFFICIDSDLRYLKGENISAANGILQTYTYSWENHCAYNLCHPPRPFGNKGKRFNFETFLKRYASIVYKPFLFMLSQERQRLNTFTCDKFKRCITLQYLRGDEEKNGALLLKQLEKQLETATEAAEKDPSFHFKEEAMRYKHLGLKETNAFFYVRGHCLYNTLVSIGSRVYKLNAPEFKTNILRTPLSFGQYREIEQIKKDIESLQNLREQSYQ